MALERTLQDVVDAASHELGRAVAVDDPRFRLLAYSEHQEDVDAARLASVLKRAHPPELVAWIDGHGVRTAERPLRLPANRAFGMDARVCVALRRDGRLLGYLWIVDRDATLTAPQLAALEAIGEAAGAVLLRELLTSEREREAERELTRALLADDAAARERAAAQLVERGLLATDGPIAAIVVPLPDGLAGEQAEALALSIEGTVQRLRRGLAPKHALHLLAPGHLLFVVSLHEPGVRAQGIAALTEQLRAELAPLLAEHDRRARAAIGGEVAGLADARASSEQALRAAEVATLVSERFGDVVCWDELGVFGLVAQLPLDELGACLIHPGLQRLLDDPRQRALLHTLEHYLDNAGDAQATAAALYLHRTTLYHRLHRIEQLAGVSLRDGEDRLALHLGLKVARLRGASWSHEPSGAARRTA